MRLALPPPLHRNEDIAPVFIVGSGRSGNTLLRRLLMAGEEVYIPPETYVLARAIRDYRTRFAHGWEIRCARVLDLFATSEDAATFPTQDFGDLLDRVCDMPENQRSLARLLEEFYLHLARAAGSHALRWGDKTPLNAFHLNRIHAVFPLAQYIHVVRDGYDVVSSYKQMGRYGSIREAAERWQRAVAAIAAFERRHRAQVRTVHYEDLVAEPRMTLSGLCGWLGIGFSEGMLAPPADPSALGDVATHVHHANVAGPVTAASIGKGRKALSASERQTARAIIAPDMKRLGYLP